MRTVGCVHVKHMDSTSSRNTRTAFLVIVGICALKDVEMMSKREIQWEVHHVHVGPFGCLWHFEYSLIWNMCPFLPFPFFLSSLLALWTALFSLIWKKRKYLALRRSNSIWNSHCRCILQGCSVPGSLDMPCIQVCAILRVSRTALGCSLHFWLDLSSFLCSVLPHKCVAGEQQCWSFTAELTHPLLHKDPR